MSAERIDRALPRIVEDGRWWRVTAAAPKEDS
jgi:hypothetical protein